MTLEERQPRVYELFDQAVGLPEPERGAFLDQACKDDPPEIRSAVERLLQADEAALAETDFLESPPIDLGEVAEPRDPMIGQRVGHYLVKRRLGKGGFGNVYLGLRSDDYEQKAAIKILRSDLASEEDVLTRFELERQLLADLQHENICRLLDGGTTDDGRPYFVMEYIDGKPITDYCDEEQLTLEQRLKKFQEVCRAVSYAHRYSVIHRDIKPSNILVTSEGMPKLLDFGIAKLIDPRSKRRGLTLSLQGQPLTPEYASPEQVQGKAVSTQTDVYSLGVLLYELLTGRLPYDFPNRLLKEIERVICEEEPQTPSLAVTRSTEVLHADGSSEQRPPEAITAARKTDPRRLSRVLSGDLDNIVLMALRKESEKRYDSPDDLVEDISNHLDGRPINARRISRAAKAWRWCRRNPAVASLAALLVFSLIAGIGGTTRMWLIAKQEAEEAKRQARLSNARRIATCATQALADHLPQRATLLAIEAAKLHLNRNELPAREARQVLYGVLGTVAGMPLTGHRLDISDVTISPNGRWLVTASNDKTARLWDLNAKDPSARSIVLRGHEQGISSVSISPNGRWLVTASDDTTARLWDLSTKDPSARSIVLRGHEEGISSVAIGPNGRWLVTGSWDSTARRWDLNSEDPSKTRGVLRGHEEGISSVAIGPNGRVLSASVQFLMPAR